MNTFVGVLLAVAFLIGLVKLLRAEEDAREKTERERALGRPRLRVPLPPREVLPEEDQDEEQRGA